MFFDCLFDRPDLYCLYLVVTIIGSDNTVFDFFCSLYAINATNAQLVATMPISHARNNGWEDIAIGPGPGSEPGSYIYILDTNSDSTVR